jgi:hypothetical protein
MEEILAVAPFYVPSVTGVSNLYGESANAKIWAHYYRSGADCYWTYAHPFF